MFALAIGSVASSQISTALTAQTDQNQRTEKTVVQAAPPATYLQALAFGYMVVLLSAIAATAPIMRHFVQSDVPLFAAFRAADAVLAPTSK